jgi:hypothetical protein
MLILTVLTANIWYGNYERAELTGVGMRDVIWFAAMRKYKGISVATLLHCIVQVRKSI